MAFNIGEFLSKGIMNGDKPNWIGVGLTAALAGGAALFTSGLGPVFMVISTLAVGAAGLALGGLIGDSFDAPPQNTSKEALAKYAPKKDIYIEENGKAKPVTIETIDPEVVRKDYTSREGVIPKKEKSFRRYVINGTNAEESAKYANELVTQLALANEYGDEKSFNTLKKGLANEQARNKAIIEGQDEFHALNGRWSNREEWQGIEAGLLHMELDDHRLADMVSKHGSEGFQEFSQETPIANLVQNANLVLEERIKTLYDRLKENETPAPATWVITPSSSHERIDNMVSTYLGYYKDGQLAYADQLIDQGISGDGGGVGSFRGFEGKLSNLGPEAQGKYHDLMELNAAIQIQQELYKIEKDASDIAKTQLQKHNSDQARLEKKAISTQRVKELAVTTEEPATKTKKAEPAADESAALDSDSMRKAKEAINGSFDINSDINNSILRDAPTQLASTPLDSNGLPLKGGDLLKPDSGKGMNA